MMIAWESRAESPKQWSVRIEALVVRLPLKHGLTLRAKLRDDNTVESGVEELRKMIGDGRAALVAAPVCWSADETEAVSATLSEIRYQTKPMSPAGPQNLFDSFGQSLLMKRRVYPPEGLTQIAIPEAFETRNVGVTLTLVPSVGAEGRAVTLSLEFDHCDYLGMRNTRILPTGNFTSLFFQPEFQRLHASGMTGLADRLWRLVNVSVLTDEKPQMEFTLLRATTFPIVP